jgi:hypothetical protein
MRRVARRSLAEATFTASSNSDVAVRHLANHSLAVKGIWVDVVAPGVFHPDSHSGFSGWLESVPNSQDGMDLLTEELEDTTTSDNRLLFTTSGGMKGIGHQVPKRETVFSCSRAEGFLSPCAGPGRNNIGWLGNVMSRV